jgi:hypothetical protein
MIDAARLAAWLPFSKYHNVQHAFYTPEPDQGKPFLAISGDSVHSVFRRNACFDPLSKVLINQQR